MDNSKITLIVRRCQEGKTFIAINLIENEIARFDDELLVDIELKN